MKIRLKSIFAIGSTLQMTSEVNGDNDLVLDVEPHTTVKAMLHQLPLTGPVPSMDDLMIHVFVNGKLQGFDHVLQPGDDIDLHIPVSGG